VKTRKRKQNIPTIWHIVKGENAFIDFLFFTKAPSDICEMDITLSHDEYKAAEAVGILMGRKGFVPNPDGFYLELDDDEPIYYRPYEYQCQP